MVMRILFRSDVEGLVQALTELQLSILEMRCQSNANKVNNLSSTIMEIVEGVGGRSGLGEYALGLLEWYSNDQT